MGNKFEAEFVQAISLTQESIQLNLDKDNFQKVMCCLGFTNQIVVGAKEAKMINELWEIL
jgi:hypothetical protein